jgi:starvation-inducible DNA-binding protein
MDHRLRIGRRLILPTDATPMPTHCNQKGASMTMTLESTTARRQAPLHTPTSLGTEARRDIGGGLGALGGTTLRSIGDIARHQRLSDNDAPFVTPPDMLAELREDNLRLVDFMRATHAMCDGYGDVATASLLEVWIDEAERRAWFLFESGRDV